MVFVNRHDFANALKRASKIAIKSSAIASVRNVRLTLDAESLTLRTTNLDTALVEVLPVQSAGMVKLVSTCIPVSQLVGVVHALPPGVQDIQFEASPEHVIVETTKLGSGCPLEDYPVIPRIPDKARALVELSEDFTRDIRFVRTAVSQEPLREVLQGVYFDFAHGNLAASDGKRLHCARVWNPSQVPNVVIPPGAFDVDVLTHLVIPQPSKGRVNDVFFYVENGYVTTRTLEGHFPDYTQLVRKEHQVTATIDRETLVSALEQALPMLNERAPACMLHLNEHFELRADNTDAGSSYTNEVPAVLAGPELRTYVNPFHLLATLRTMPSENVTLAFGKPDQAIHVSSETGEHWALLMPLNITDKPQPPDREKTASVHERSAR